MPIVTSRAATLVVDRPAPRGEATGRFYLPQLDGLRFCAFLLVFIHHAPVFPGGSRGAAAIKELGWVGVDLFFVLSAYLLVALLDREHAATGATDFRKFLLRRVLRIWPLFYVFVALCFIYFLAFDGNDGAFVTRRAIGHLAFLDNVVTAATGDYNPLNFTQHLWTIAFEEQIYLVIPLLFMAIVRLRRHRAILVVAATAILVSQPLLRFWVSPADITAWLTPFLHFDTIFAGLLLGAGAGMGLKARVPGIVLVLSGTLVLGIVIFVPPDSELVALLPDRIVYVFTLLALAFFLIVLGSLDSGSLVARFLASQPLVFLGRISYGLYVWHLVGIEFGPRLAHAWFPRLGDSSGGIQNWLSIVLTSMSLTVVLAVLSYFLLERPFLRIKSRFTVVPNRRD